MYSKINTYKFTCDKCGATAVEHAENPTLPLHWVSAQTSTIEKVNGWDAVVPKIIDLCPLCQTHPKKKSK